MAPMALIRADHGSITEFLQDTENCTNVKSMWNVKNYGVVDLVRCIDSNLKFCSNFIDFLPIAHIIHTACICLFIELGGYIVSIRCCDCGHSPLQLAAAKKKPLGVCGERVNRNAVVRRKITPDEGKSTPDKKIGERGI